MLIKKILNISGLVTATILKKKVGEIERKIPDFSGLVITAVFKRKILEVDKKLPDYAQYITDLEFNRFVGFIFEAKLNQSNLAINNNVHAVSQCSHENKEKIKKLQTLDLSYFPVSF